LLSSTPGLLPRKNISFSMFFSFSKLSSRIYLVALLTNMDIQGCKEDV